MTTAIELEFPFASPLYDESIELRDLVLRKPLGMQFQASDLATEYDSHHLALMHFSDYRMLAVLVMKPISTSEVKMRQVAVHPDFQGKRLGTALVAFAERFALSHSYDSIVLSAREPAVAFYRRLDYALVTDRYEEIGIPHFGMKKVLQPSSITA